MHLKTAKWDGQWAVLWARLRLNTDRRAVSPVELVSSHLPLLVLAQHRPFVRPNICSLVLTSWINCSGTDLMRHAASRQLLSNQQQTVTSLTNKWLNKQQEEHRVDAQRIWASFVSYLLTVDTLCWLAAEWGRGAFNWSHQVCKETCLKMCF